MNAINIEYLQVGAGGAVCRPAGPVHKHLD